MLIIKEKGVLTMAEDFPAAAEKTAQVVALDELLAVLTLPSVTKILVYYGPNTPYEITGGTTTSDDMTTTLIDDLTAERAALVAEIKIDVDC